MNSHVRIQNVTILAPTGSPNTDGIDPGQFSPLGWKAIPYVINNAQIFVIVFKRFARFS
jgi:hypothetical protein